MKLAEATLENLKARLSHKTYGRSVADGICYRILKNMIDDVDSMLNLLLPFESIVYSFEEDCTEHWKSKLGSKFEILTEFKNGSTFTPEQWLITFTRLPDSDDII